MKTQMKKKWKNNNFKHFQSVARCESYNPIKKEWDKPTSFGYPGVDRSG